jgi:hypothetical protein
MLELTHELTGPVHPTLIAGLAVEILVVYLSIALLNAGRRLSRDDLRKPRSR